MNIAAQVKRAPLPDGLRYLAGEIMDIDSHEMMPAQVWVRECGPIAERLARDWLNNGTDFTTNINNPNVPGYGRDDAPIDADSIWAQKGSPAPGAVDVSPRDQIMDLMGIKRQLMFPTGVGMYGTMLASSLEYDYGLSPSITENRKEYGREMINAYTVDKYVTQYGLDDILCFASDYPHVEGDRNPIGRWYQRLAPLGAHIVEKFFVTNGKWLLPD